MTVPATSRASFIVGSIVLGPVAISFQVFPSRLFRRKTSTTCVTKIVNMRTAAARWRKPAPSNPPKTFESVRAHGVNENLSVSPVSASVMKLTIRLMCIVRSRRVNRMNWGSFAPTASCAASSAFSSRRIFRARGSQRRVWRPLTVKVPTRSAVIPQNVKKRIGYFFLSWCVACER